MCFVICSKGYPDKFQKNIEIKNTEKVIQNSAEFLFHAGTLKKDNKTFAVGGRVLNIVALSNKFSIAKNKALENIMRLNWSGGFYRKDIGHKVIEE